MLLVVMCAQRACGSRLLQPAVEAQQKSTPPLTNLRSLSRLGGMLCRQGRMPLHGSLCWSFSSPPECREKESGGALDIPGGGKLIELEYASVEDRKLRGQLRNVPKLELLVRAARASVP